MKKILPIIMIVSTFSFADYSLKIFLENQNISFKSNENTGEDESSSIIRNFSVNRNKFTIGDKAVFSWDVTNNKALEIVPFGAINNESTIQAIDLNSIGNFNYKLLSTNFDGSKTESNNINIEVYGEPEILSYTVNNQKNTYAEVGDILNFNWNQNNGDHITLDGNYVSGNSSTITATTTKQYQLVVTNGAGKSLNDNVTVNVIGVSNINYLNAPSNVFVSSPFTLSWDGENIEKYELSGLSGSGVGTSEDLGKITNKIVTPSNSGTFSYLLKGKSLSGKSIELNKEVIVENNPTFTSFTVNGQSSITVAPNSSLNFEGTGFSTGSTLQGRDINNSNNEILPQNANTIAGSTTYYASATKTLNNITRNSPVKSVSVTVVNNPIIGNINAPTNVFVGSAFTMSWTGSDISNYKIKSNNDNSGIPTTDIEMGTDTSKVITPNTSGTYIYTLTATNSANIESSSTVTVIAEETPKFTNFTVNGETTINVAPSTPITFSYSGLSSGSSFQARNSSNTTNESLPQNAPSIVGTYHYYGAAIKSLNGENRYSQLRTVTINVVENWVSTDPKYTEWVNSGSPTNCSAWTPPSSEYETTVKVNQTRSCSQNQTRTRQNREEEATTKAIRNVGSPITEGQVVTVNESQTVDGTMDCRFTSGSSYWTQRDGLTLSIAFDGLVIYDKVSYPDGNANTILSVEYNGVTYKRGLKRSSSNYYVCKT